MATIRTLARTSTEHGVELTRVAVVFGCALSLALAGAMLPAL